MARELSDRVEAWRQEKGVDKCIACGFDGEMGYARMIAAPIMGADLQVELNIGGKTTSVIGMLPTVCPNCGYMMFFEPTTLGIVDSPDQ
jgi:hypothetical protein